MNSNENTAIIQRLLKEVEQTSGITMHAPSDFEQLSRLVFNQLHDTLSPSTLKRLWGYAGQDTHPRAYTLNVLAQFVGYKNFESYEEASGQVQKLQSQLFLTDAISADQLGEGDMLQLTWHPDRRCVVEHLGKGRFMVRKSENAKLWVGDTFECHLFINHEPLYIDGLIHNGMSPMSYVAGRIDGIVARKITSDEWRKMQDAAM